MVYNNDKVSLFITSKSVTWDVNAQHWAGTLIHRGTESILQMSSIQLL